MALRKTLAICPLIFSAARSQAGPRSVAQHELLGSSDRPNIRREHYGTSPDSASRQIFRRFLQRRILDNNDPSQRLRGISIPGGDRLRFDGISPPTMMDPQGGGLSMVDVRKILKLSLQKLTSRLKELPDASITYGELVRICSESCGGDGNKAVELAKSLDESANVIVLGNTVFLKPDQVAKSMEALISRTIPGPNDPRRRLLERMERQKARIEEQSRAHVRAELYGGLGLVVAQTLAFMRLTFWELNWDVMEPICFFAASLHFAAAYAFFLHTSVEPSFQGIFQQRFRTRQRKLMAARGFYVEEYDRLRRVFYPAYGGNCRYKEFSTSYNLQ